MSTHFDLAALRAMAVGMELGSFAQAARRLNRSQSAVSMQLRKLEQQAGQPLFVRSGRGLRLTEAGQRLLRYARQMLLLNDEAAAELGVAAGAATVRIGMPQDFADVMLAELLSRFARARPGVSVEVRAGRNFALADDVAGGRLDLALAYAEPAQARRQAIARMARLWIALPGLAAKLSKRQPVPLVLFDPPCVFRQIAIGALDRAGQPWRLALTTPSLAGVWAGVRAGLGVTVRTAIGVPAQLSALTSAEALPKLPPVAVVVHCASDPGPTVRLLRELLQQMLAEQCRQGRRAA